MNKHLPLALRTGRGRCTPDHLTAGNLSRKDKKMLYLVKQRAHPMFDAKKAIQISDERLDLLANRYLARNVGRVCGVPFETYLLGNL